MDVMFSRTSSAKSDFSSIVMPSNEDESSDFASVDFSKNLVNKRLNLMEGRDYISDLPDFVIHHILSLLPSTKQAIKTGVLSKRWKNQWTHVPVLVFKFEHLALPHNILSIFQHVLSLYQCSRVMKFECYSLDDGENRLNLVSCFAAARNVEELILIHLGYYEGTLPKLLFEIASLVRLNLRKYHFKPNENVKWGRLKALKLEKCILSDEGIQNALSGSPLLEALNLSYCSWRTQLVIASQSLQELIILGYYEPIIEIFCPKLQTLKCDRCKFRGQFIQTISSGCPLLESMKLSTCGLYGLEPIAISFKSLKRLSLGEHLGHIDAGNGKEISRELKISEISCPKLEKLKLCDGFDFLPGTVMNFSSVVRASLSLRKERSWFQNILQQLEHVKELSICYRSLKVLSNTGEAFLSAPLLNNSLVLKLDCWGEHSDGIAWALQNFPVLEELAVKLPESQYTHPDSNGNYWDSCNVVFGCLESHLRVVKIINISKQNGQWGIALDFIEFLLKRGKVLEKLVVILKHSEADFTSELYQKLLSFYKCNKSVAIELLEDINY